MIARMLVRGGLLTLALTVAMATANSICWSMRSPSSPNAEAKRTRSERVRSRSASKSRRQSHPPRSAKSHTA
jgi:hypothetical protein